MVVILKGRRCTSIRKCRINLPEAQIHDVIVNGKGGMPGGLIKGEEAHAVAKWLSEKK